MKAETLQAVRGFVSAELGVPVARVTQTTRLLHDLGVDGDAAGDLLQHFSARFHVDFSAFRFSWHFGPEAGWSPFYDIYCFLFARGRHRDMPILPAERQ